MMFSAKRQVALNFSDYSLEVVELEFSGGRYTVTAYGRALLDTSVIEDGKIIQPDKLREAVMRVLTQAKPAAIKTQEVAITLPESKIFTEVVSLPRSAEKRSLPSQLLAKARESIPIDLSLIAADYHVISQDADEIRYLLAATFCNLVEDYKKFFESLKLRVSLMTMESLALAAASVEEAAQGTVLLLDIGARTTIASIFRGGRLIETINIGIAGNAITAAIAEKMKMSLEEAEQRKIQTGLQTGANGSTEMMIIQGQLQPLKDELVSFIRYYESSSHDAVSQVLMTGGTAALIGLDEYFAANLGIPVRTAQPLEVFNVAMDLPAVTKFLVALGCARLALHPPSRTVIDFSKRSPKEWRLPAPIVKKEVLHAEPAAAAAHTGLGARAVKVALLLGVAIIAANILLWAWYMKQDRSGSETQIPPEEQAPSPSIPEPPPVIAVNNQPARSITFGFTIVTDPERALGEDLIATQNQITVEQTTVYEEALLEEVMTSLYAEGKEATAEDIQRQLGEHLARALWHERYTALARSYESQGERLLETYARATIVSMVSAGQASGKVHLQALFDAYVLTDAAAYEAVETEAISGFLRQYPEYAVQARKFTYTTDDEGSRIRVLAEISMMETLNQ